LGPASQSHNVEAIKEALDTTRHTKACLEAGLVMQSWSERSPFSDPSTALPALRQYNDCLSNQMKQSLLSGAIWGSMAMAIPGITHRLVRVGAVLVATGLGAASNYTPAPCVVRAMADPVIGPEVRAVYRKQFPASFYPSVCEEVAARRGRPGGEDVSLERELQQVCVCRHSGLNHSMHYTALWMWWAPLRQCPLSPPPPRFPSPPPHPRMCAAPAAACGPTKPGQGW
jgi:hypothetical protein